MDPQGEPPRGSAGDLAPSGLADAALGEEKRSRSSPKTDIHWATSPETADNITSEGSKSGGMPAEGGEPAASLPAAAVRQGDGAAQVQVAGDRQDGVVGSGRLWWAYEPVASAGGSIPGGQLPRESLHRAAVLPVPVAETSTGPGGEGDARAGAGGSHDRDASQSRDGPGSRNGAMEGLECWASSMVVRVQCPIRVVDHKDGVYECHAEGKEAQTVRRLALKSCSSVRSASCRRCVGCLAGLRRKAWCNTRPVEWLSRVLWHGMACYAVSCLEEAADCIPRLE